MVGKIEELHKCPEDQIHFCGICEAVIGVRYGDHADPVSACKRVHGFIRYKFIGCSLDGGASICIPGYSRILRQPDNTNTGYLEYCPPEERFSDIVAKIDFKCKDKKEY